MKKILLPILFCFFASTQASFASLSKHIVNYKIKAQLDPEAKAVIGEETLTWLNDSDSPVSELQFHLYLNAFKNNRSTFMKEGRGAHRWFKLGKENWGYIEIKKIEIAGGPDLTSGIGYIQPDDGNRDDQTVMWIGLPEPVPPQAQITLYIEFYSKLPKIFARSGFHKNFFMVAQWFPKIGVLWNGKWNCHQYHLNSEFFSDFGVYEVEITVPEKFVVGASGRRIKEEKRGASMKTYTYYGEDIHDFAWTACPRFLEFREEFSLNEPKVRTEIILLVHSSHLSQRERYLSSLKNAIQFYSENYGAYPYPTITLVDPAPGAWGAGGMEYPTLFTSMTTSWLPKDVYLTEMVTLHEFGHNYWYGMVASNEFEEAWLDEGINSYSEIKAMAKYYGAETSILNWRGLKIGDFVFQRLQVVGSGRMDPILKNSWEYSSGGSYSLNVYSKAALMLLTLEKHLGEEIMSRIMKTYFERWQFKHPASKDFIALAEEVSGQDLKWFFDQFLRSPDKLDYAIGEIKYEAIKEPEGIFEKEDKGAKKKRVQENEKREEAYKNEVLVIRSGEMVFPQEILIVFENGERIREKWDGQERWKRYVYFKPSRLKFAQIDPQNKLVLDVNYTNNSKLLKPKKLPALKYALSLMVRFQNILAFASF